MADLSPAPIDRARAARITLSVLEDDRDAFIGVANEIVTDDRAHAYLAVLSAFGTETANNGITSYGRENAIEALKLFVLSQQLEPQQKEEP